MLTRLWKTNPPLTITGLLMLPALALAIAGLILDPRLIAGAPAWLKPVKFALSIAVYVSTLAWTFTFIPDFKRTRRIVGWVTSMVMVLELAIIDLQAYRGTTSHFNFSTPLNGALFTIMGVAIVLQTLTSVTIAIALWQQEFEDQALGWALRVGMIITIIGGFSGALMTRPTAAQLDAARAGQAMPVVGSHTVGAPDGGRGIPGAGWSTRCGDLRVPHFIGLHAFQVLPLIAFALRRRRLPGGLRVPLSLITAGSYFALFVILLVQALRGQSILNPDALTIEMLGVWVLVTATCSWRFATRVRTIGTPELV